MGAVVQFPKDRIVRTPELVAALTAPSALEAQKGVVVGLLVKRARAKGKEVTDPQARAALEAAIASTPMRRLDEGLEDLARMGFEYNVRRGKPDTMERARKRVAKAREEIEARFWQQKEREAKLDRMAELVVQRNARKGVATTKQAVREAITDTLAEIREARNE
ncbi:hypothetical protein [Pseudoxanthomonas sp. X-1]|uniref:hypothetical protein n=1 Tax=Pseudoxanthomonas sp. X-1 TaxID=2571115 RepID=UPI00110A136D|nr:hypothetical protein [Pseudoxanthomonas sp. X-1]TMN24527.1 hypothetical protein FF950_05465 [Pseudoxanthomonas sp. X-1]UAY75203.1 hypothetical protein LAJ50_02760 [Pseudoxanthomonas sp. X-1]